MLPKKVDSPHHLEITPHLTPMGEQRILNDVEDVLGFLAGCDDCRYACVRRDIGRDKLCFHTACSELRTQRRGTNYIDDRQNEVRTKSFQ